MRKHLAKKERRELEKKTAEVFGDAVLFSKKDTVELVDEKIILINGFPSFFYSEGMLTPTLKYLMDTPLLKSVTVDMGAVKFVTSGADVMRPGITELNDRIRKDDLVVIVDEQHKKPLAIGRVLFSGEEIAQKMHGKVISTIHYVGDEIWKY
ncbi:RNA-binding protein [Candidatus Woesearchaeota archaeon CG_4_10_14_0_8_um_filter_47_5]|nr:MAG: RNA-binding protein [Candidatus Woesearchaeota archaeon CG_4_10_14_0_8_um_filter_47_5]